MVSTEIKILQTENFNTLSVEIRSDGLARVNVKANEEIDVKNVMEVVSVLEKFWV